MKTMGYSLNNPFISLHHKNYRIYIAGMIVSLIGTWMQNIAQPWLAYQLTGSPFLLSLIGVFQFLPVLLFSLFAGVIIDRFPKKQILIFTQSSSLVITLGLAILVLSGKVQYWHILIAALMIGIINTLDMPTRQSFAIELVGRSDLMNAIALNSTVFNLSRVIGPAIAGLVMAYFGVASCFIINSISFAAVLLSLFFIKPLKIERVIKTGQNIIATIRDGLTYIKNNPMLIDTLMIISILSVFAMNFSVLIPIFTAQVLKENEVVFGFLMSAFGVGSLVGAILIAALSKSGPKRYILFVFPFIVGALLMFNGFSENFVITSIILALTGFFFVSFNSNSNSFLQLNTSEEYRGRVMSVYTLIFGGSTPFGNIFAGIITEKYGAKAGFITCGVSIILLMVPLLIFISRKRGMQQIA